MNVERIRLTMDELLRAGDELADRALEFADDRQPTEAERCRQRAVAVYGAVVQLGVAFVQPREQIIAMTRMACVSADAGARDAALDLLHRAEQLAGEAEADDLINSIQVERMELAGVVS